MGDKEFDYQVIFLGPIHFSTRINRSFIYSLAIRIDMESAGQQACNLIQS